MESQPPLRVGWKSLFSFVDIASNIRHLRSLVSLSVPFPTHITSPSSGRSSEVARTSTRSGIYFRHQCVLVAARVLEKDTVSGKHLVGEGG